MSKIGDDIAAALARFEEENTKLEGGNKAAGVRARKALLEIKALAAEGRKALSPSKSEPNAAE